MYVYVRVRVRVCVCVCEDSYLQRCVARQVVPGVSKNRVA